MFKYKNLQTESESISRENKFAQTVLEGLSLEQKRLPSWLIFDSKGSEIFNKITQLPEYLPAACEFEIFNTYKKWITELISKETFQIIELGSGDGEKTKILIENILNNKIDFHYYPIDISKGAIENLVNNLNLKFANTSLKVTGLVADYFDGLKNITIRENHRNLVLFLGITLNNMDLPDAKSFLRKLHQLLNDKDYLLIGFDLIKNPKLLYTAYNDSKGLFENFNLHLLDRINQVLDGNFKKELFIQQGHYNPKSHAIESYIYRIRNQTVYINGLNREFKFKAWEGIQTEQSFKYSTEDIKILAEENGFEVQESLYDSNKYFVDSVWRVKK